MDIIFVLVFTSLVPNVGPVTIRTEFATLALCEQEKHTRTMAAGDRMMHAHCEEKKGV